MNDDAAIMKREIHAIANHRALILSKYLMNLLLGAASLYLGFKRYALSPFYILLVLNILPPILNYAFKEYSQNNRGKSLAGIINDPPFLLKLLKAKYKYSRLKYVSNTIAHSASLVLLLLWQLNYSSVKDTDKLLLYLPFTILAAGVFLRFLGVFIYLAKLPYDLSHNKL